MFPYFPMMYPWIPTNCDKPPTLYALLNSMLNYENNNPIKIKDLASNGAIKIFDFEYPLSTHVDKNTFETMILNHFLMRRIGFDTFTAFQIALNVKMNEIMPYYNKLLDFLDGWDLFADGEVTTRIVDEDKTIHNNSTSSNNTINNMQVTDNNTQDLRHSDMPQNRLQDIQDGTYLSTYDYNKVDNISNSESTINSSDTSMNNTTDDTDIKETITRTPSNKIELYKEFITNQNKIYTMIFNDLDSLFYQLI